MDDADTGYVFCEAALAFMDIHPANDGHCLVIPKSHYPTIFDIPPHTFTSISSLVARVARAVQHALQPPGLSLVQANGPAANQTVPHLHIHVLPRRSDDGLLLNWSRTAEGDPAGIAEIAEQIRRHLRP
jgi:histidine triad (HIT) family protein